MAIIPLRAYNREIEGMIDNGQLDEAVAHCRQILATFPKHITTYRLLGKAHLEQQRISDATDIFQRVLSSIPDDFIANVGMSIIREDENNLDASIWHMELAYEAQPSNIAIQDELRRLYGRRDGIQPPKVRLTRGALARMYAKGGLLDQAVAELRAAISEDPNRYDLQLLLAGMFFQTSQRVEAVETCAYILKKLPFCLAANQIMAVCMPENESAGTGKNYRQIAISMDPYYAFAAQDAISSDQVPENSVNIERLEWKSGIQMGDASAQPTWATSLGVSMEKSPEEKLPEWLKGTEAPVTPETGEKAQPSVSPFIWDTQEVEKIITEDTKPEDEIPDWMKDAGWKPAPSESIQAPGETVTEPPIIEAQPQEDLEKGEIPDWLRGIAPEGMLEDETTTSQPQEKDTSIPWLEKQEPGPTDSIIQWLEDAKPETPVAQAKLDSTPTEMAEEEIPDWLKDLDTPYPPPTQVEQVSQEAITSPSIPGAFIEEPVVVEPSESLVKKAPPFDGSLEQIIKIEAVRELIDTKPAAEVVETKELPAEPAEEVPDWIKELAGETPETIAPAFSGEELSAELPTIAEKQPTTEIPAIHEEVPTIEQPVTVEAALGEETSVTVSEQPIGETAIPAEETPPVELPSIVKEKTTRILPVLGKEIPAAEVPNLIEEQAQKEQPVVTEAELKPEVSITPGEAAAIALVGGLAVKKGAEEQEPPTPPISEQEATPPEWVKLEAEAISAETHPELEPQTVEAPAIPAEEIPDWIKGLGETPEIEEVAIEPVSAISPEPVTPQTEELPAWLIEAEQVKEETETPIPSQEALEWKEEEIPDWIKEITETALPKEVTTSIEQPVPQSEPISEWAAAETPITEEGEVKAIEPQPVESAWALAAEEPIQQVTADAVEAEVETAAALPEQPVIPDIEAPEDELSKLEVARNAINQGSLAKAIEVYTSLIRRNHHLEEVIKDIQAALYQFPVDINLWMTLGDAYLHTDELQEALNTYAKAEDLVR